MTDSPAVISSQIASVLKRTANHTSADRRWALKDHIAGFRAVDLQAFLAEEGVRFTGQPKRAEVVGEILDTFAPVD